jgi:3-oxoacyl-[acyl-carrier-protein] synthase II
MRRVVVTGLGALTPIGNNVPEYLEGLRNGVSGVAPITLFDANEFKTRFAAEIKNFDPEQYLDKKEVRKNDRFTHFAYAVADEAMKDSGLNPETLDLDRIGVIWGSGIGGLSTLEKEITDYVKGSGVPRYNPFTIPKMITNIAAGMLAIKYGFRGVNYATVSACASASHAMINAFDYIRLNKADVFLAGGSEAVITATTVGGFTSMKAMSERNDDPATASRPFDANRDGFVLGEGAGCIVLEEYEHAVARGAKIYCEIVGSGMTCDAYHMTAPHPEGLGVIAVMKTALKEAGLSTSDLDYINVHGTSTPLGDVAELKAIQNVFGDDAYDLNISSTKSMTGHLLGAAGAIEAIATILAMEHSFIPPTINHSTVDETIDPKLNLTLNTTQYREVNVAMSNTFGFGGHNTSIIFKK